MQPTSELLSASFLGPMVPSPDAGGRNRHVYASLLHWYESAKFMPHRPDLRDGVLFAPTFKEASRYARLRQKDWRTDWELVRPGVLVAGLAFLSLYRPELGVIAWPTERLRTEIAPMGLPARFVHACLERFDQWRQGPRVGYYGADQAPDALVGQKVTKLLSPTATWTLVSVCNHRAAWKLHDWALMNYIPVLYVGGPTTRMNRDTLAKVVDLSDQILVFEKRGGKSADNIIALAKAKKKRLTLDLYDPPTQAAAGDLLGAANTHDAPPPRKTAPRTTRRTL